MTFWKPTRKPWFFKNDDSTIGADQDAQQLIDEVGPTTGGDVREVEAAIARDRMLDKRKNYQRAARKTWTKRKQKIAAHQL